MNNEEFHYPGFEKRGISLLKSAVKPLVCIIIPIIIVLLPPPNGLDSQAWYLFALYIGAILGLMLRPLPEPAVILIAIGLSSVVLKNTNTLLLGYANSVTWLVFSAFMVGAAFVETGLGRRIAYLLIGKFGGSSLGLGYVATITDLVLSPATPSNTARTGGIVYPIFRSIAVTLNSEPGPTARKIGAYLTLLLYEVSLSTSYVFMTAVAPNGLIASFANKILKVQIDWLTWFQAAAAPGLVCLLIIPWLVHKMYPAQIGKIDNKKIADQGLQDLGPLSRNEKILIVLFILAIVGWATGTITKIDATAVAIGFLAACLFTRIIRWESLVTNQGAWSTLIWYGGIIGLADGLGKAKFFDWMAKFLGSNLNFAGYSPIAILAVLLFFSVAVRYFFASMAAYVTTMIPVFFTIGLVAQVPIMPLAFLISFSAAYGSLLTHYGGAAGAVLYGPGYVDQVTWWKVGAAVVVMSVIVHLAIGLPYWRMLGFW